MNHFFFFVDEHLSDCHSIIEKIEFKDDLIVWNSEKCTKKSKLCHYTKVPLNNSDFNRFYFLFLFAFDNLIKN